MDQRATSIVLSNSMHQQLKIALLALRHKINKIKGSPN